MNNYFFNPYNNQSGLSVIEVMLAAALFVLFSSGSVVVILQGFDANRLGAEQTIATQYASEGIEAARSIKNRGFSNLVTSAGVGVSAVGGVWTFNGTNNVMNKYTRVISVADVQRDGSGNIVASGGTVDSSTKKISSTVSWNFSAGRANTVGFSTYLSNWRTAKKGGMMVYGDKSGLADVMRYKLLDSTGTWGTEQTVTSFSVPLNRDLRSLKVYSSATRNEKIIVAKFVANGAGNDQYIYAAVWNGTTWGNIVQLSSWAGTTRPFLRNFDGDYLTNGNFLVVYDNDTTTPQYSIWNGTSWSAGAATSNVGGIPEWIVVRNKPGTNEAMVGIADDQQDTNTIYWNGTTWSAATEHGTAYGALGPDMIDFRWSVTTPASGVLVYNEANDSFPNIRVWNGSWGTAIENSDIGSNVRALQVAARPTANEFLGCFKDSASDINCLESDLTPLWTVPTNTQIATATVTGDNRTFSQQYETASGSTGLVVYSNGANTTAKSIPKYRTYDTATNTLSAEGSLTTVVNQIEAIQTIANPTTDDIMVLMATTNQDLWTVVWDGTNNAFYSTGGYAQTIQGLSGSNDTDFWFDFAWDKF